ncbi:MAG: DNA repair protein RecN [Actinobacteria bacterium]|nr:MAG: DNA repair protein RecN [Actinomycetota bacterium]
MLCELRVENLLLIEQAQLRLAPGLNVLTGETGAGKTVLAHALDLLLGGRARTGIVRPGAQEAYVEGVFALQQGETPLQASIGERLAPGAEELVLARRVGSDGRTRAYLNGRTIAVGEMREIGAALVCFYGQHEHRKLTIASSQLELLDSLCGPEHAARLRACAASCSQVARLRAQLAELDERERARERELELLEHERSELEASEEELRAYESLLQTRERLRRAGALQQAAEAGAHALSPGDTVDAAEADAGVPGAQRLAAAVSSLQALAGVDERLDALSERLSEVLIESQDLGSELHRYAEELAGVALDDGGGLDALEERLLPVERLLRKHGGSVSSTLAHAEDASRRLRELRSEQAASCELEAHLAQASAELEEHDAALRRARVAAAPGFQKAVCGELQALALAGASFEVALWRREVGPSGGDEVEFVIAPNPGVPAGPLREIASGGELARVMLAIMSVATSPAGAPTLVFDEVDAGIGGHAARAVGARLRALAQRRQLLCITHLPQIASLGERHFAIVKDTRAGSTSATVTELAEQEVVSELVRMLGADSADSGALRHARELRRAA